MVDVQIRFSAEVLPFSFEPERKERLILDKPPQYYPLFDFWEEESQSEPQIHKEKHENDDDSNWEKPEPIEIHVDERNNIGTNDIEADEAMEEADAEFEFQNYLRQIDDEIALDKELEYNDYYDCDEYVKYEEDFEIAFFHSKKAHPKRIRNTSHYKKEKINPDRCINAYTYVLCLFYHSGYNKMSNSLNLVKNAKNSASNSSFKAMLFLKVMCLLSTGVSFPLLESSTVVNLLLYPQSTTTTTTPNTIALTTLTSPKANLT